jgi:hypothetical protein
MHSEKLIATNTFVQVLTRILQVKSKGLVVSASEQPQITKF